MGGTGDVVNPRALALGLEMRRLREASGLGVRQFANQLGFSHAALSRWETGARNPRPEDVARICTALGVGNDELESLIAEAHKVGKSPWLGIGLVEAHRQLATLLEYEQIAATITSVSPLMIPGLLQTVDYARVVMQQGGLQSDDAELRVAIRMGRRDMLTREDSPSLVALLGEAALRQQVGGAEVMRAQLEHLLKVAAWQHVDLRVVPYSAGWHPGVMGNFFLVEFADASCIVHIETLATTLFLHEPKDTERYVDASTRVLRAAMSTDDSLGLIAAVMKELE
jgi:transcriptional regulator with XRE-family HTH domain